MSESPPEASPSILTSTKNALGLLEDDTSFDPELIMHINSVLSTFNQLGVGPDVGYAITNKEDTWADFLGTELRYNDAKQLVFYMVRMAFDPPGVGYVITAYEKVIEEMKYRLATTRDEIVRPYVAPEEEFPDELVILDGGGP